MVCRRCAPRRRDPLVLLCPRHQLDRPASPLSSLVGVALLRSTSVSSVGRLLARVVAITEGASVQDLLLFPLVPAPGDESSVLRAAAAEASAAFWSPSRRSDLRGPARRMWQLAVATDSLSSPPSSVTDLAVVYVGRRLDSPLPGWRPVAAVSVAKDLSALAAAARADGSAVPPYLSAAARALLAHRGAFERREHAVSQPVPPADLWSWRLDVLPSQLPALAVLMFQSVFCLRPGSSHAVRRRDLTALPDEEGAWLLRWDKPTKSRRGDRGRSLPPLGSAALPSSQISVAAGPMLAWALLHAPPGPLDVPIFPLSLSAPAAALLHARVIPVRGLVVRRHGVRAGTDVAHQAIGTPSDVLEALGWWSRARRMTGYYGAIAVSVLIVATSLVHRVRLSCVAPGLCRVTGWDSGVVIPDWPSLRSRAASSPSSAASGTPRLLASVEASSPAPSAEQSSSDEELRPVVASHSDVLACTPRAGPRLRRSLRTRL